MNLWQLMECFGQNLKSGGRSYAIQSLKDMGVSATILEAISNTIDDKGDIIENPDMILGSELKDGDEVRCLDWEFIHRENICVVRKMDSDTRTDVMLFDRERGQYFNIPNSNRYERV